MTAALPRDAATPSLPRFRLWLDSAVLARFVPTVTLLAYLFLFVPILILIAYSFNAGRSTVVWTGFTLDWYREVFDDRALGKSLWVSLIVAASSAAVSTAIGTLAALAIVKRSFRGRDALSTLMIAPLVLPEIVIAAPSPDPTSEMSFGVAANWYSATGAVLPARNSST